MEKIAVGQFAIPRRIPDERGTKNADQDGAVQLSRHEDQSQDQAKAGSLHFFVGETAEADECSWICHHELGVAQSHERDKHSNSRGSRVLQAVGHAVDNLLANASHREHKKKNS